MAMFDCGKCWLCFIALVGIGGLIVTKVRGKKRKKRIKSARCGIFIRANHWPSNTIVAACP
jgi:hypothetical protein